jgi:hypothetical protein
MRQAKLTIGILLSAIAILPAMPNSKAATITVKPKVCVRAARAACADARSVAPPGITITHSTGTSDLPYFTARDRQTVATIRLYHDAPLQALAEQKVRCLASLLGLLPPSIPDQGRNIAWRAMVITRDPAYAWDRSKHEVRWLLRLPDGKWEANADQFLLALMPHEEVHARQTALGAARLPRWFEEGHAEWAGLHVTALVRPALAQAERRKMLDAKVKHGAIDLKSWGEIRVKREAILRQLSPADRPRA